MFAVLFSIQFFKFFKRGLLFCPLVDIVWGFFVCFGWLVGWFICLFFKKYEF